MPTITNVEMRYLNRDKLDALLKREFGNDYGVKVLSLVNPSIGLRVNRCLRFRLMMSGSR